VGHTGLSQYFFEDSLRAGYNRPPELHWRHRRGDGYSRSNSL